MYLSIIIPTKEREEIFKKTLTAAIDAIEDCPAEIIVVNDSQTSCPTIPDYLPNVKLINNPKSGVASARNEGVKHSTGDLLLFLDNDIIISKQSVMHIMALHAQYPKGCFNLDWQYPQVLQELLTKSNLGRFILKHGMASFKGWYADGSWRDNALFESLSVASFHLSISKSNFDLTGGYNEQFPYAGFEDYDFPTKLKKAGLQFYIDSRVMVSHNESDRLSLDNWLANQQRRAATRKVAVNLGYHELQLEYGWIKSIVLATIGYLHPLINFLLKSFPNHIFFDPLYFKIVAINQAAVIYKGYTLQSTT
jgi:glycosyltransferase involved in cell wall biosynthesis